MAINHHIFLCEFSLKELNPINFQILVENIIMMVWWSNYCDLDAWYYIIGLILHFVLFFSGILCLVSITFGIYYCLGIYLTSPVFLVFF